MSDQLDPHGNGLAYENGFRDGLKDARADLQAALDEVRSRLHARIRELEARRDIDSEIIDDLRLRHAQAVTARDAYAEQLLAATKHAVELERQVAELKGKED